MNITTFTTAVLVNTKDLQFERKYKLTHCFWKLKKAQ